MYINIGGEREREKEKERERDIYVYIYTHMYLTIQLLICWCVHMCIYINTHIKRPQPRWILSRCVHCIGGCAVGEREHRTMNLRDLPMAVDEVWQQVS